MKKEALGIKVKDLNLKQEVKTCLAKYENCTIERFLLETGGKSYPQGIGPAGGIAVAKAIEQHGVSINEFLKGSIYELPSKLKFLFLKNQIYWIRDIRLDKIELLQMLDYNYRKFLLIEKMLKRSGIDLMKPEQDAIIYDTSLSPRAKNALYKNGYYLMSSLVGISDEKIQSFRNVGTVTAKEIISFRNEISIEEEIPRATVKDQGHECKMTAIIAIKKLPYYDLKIFSSQINKV